MGTTEFRRAFLLHLRSVENVLLWVACAGIAVMMVIITADALMRYLVGTPLSIAYDLTRMYLMPAIVFLALAHSIRQRAHIGITFFSQRFPTQVRRLIHGCTRGIGVAFFGAVSWQVGILAHRSWESGQAFTGQYSWPTWVAYAIVPLGCSVMAVRCLVEPFEEQAVEDGFDS
jgi:TRAP-type C4-dicarboxylate transport system permease small subunit